MMRVLYPILVSPEVDFERLLLDLLAIIHRDGGQYVGEHGIKKAVEDAKQKIVNNRKDTE